jgi:hypothetical protein
LDHARAGNGSSAEHANCAPAVARDPERLTALLVAGGHRSGTSAVTRALALLGADLPANLLAANEGNVAGYWESPRVVAFDEALLKEAGLTWMDLRPLELPPSEARVEYIRALMAEEFASARRPILKDPRLCRVAAPWIEALRREHAHVAVVIPVRDPHEVAASLLKRNSLRPAWGLHLWLRYVLDAERATRGEARCFLRYERFVADWRCDIRRIAAALELDWLSPDHAAAAEVDAFLDASLRRSASHADALRRELEESEAIRHALEIMARWSMDGESGSDYAALDRLRATFDEGAEALQGSLRSDRLKASAQAQGATALAVASASAARIEDMAQAVTALTARADSLETRFEEAALRILREVSAAEGLAASRAAVAQDRLAEIGEAIAKLEKGQTKRFISVEQLTQRIYEQSKSTSKAISTFQKLYKSDRSADRMRGGIMGLIDRLRAKIMRRATLRLITSSTLFDVEWYLKQNPDVARNGMNPALHFLVHGGFEGRAPGPDFDPDWYLSAYRDVADSGMNPLVHYLRHGASEGRAIRPGHDAPPAKAHRRPSPKGAPVAAPIKQRSRRFEPSDAPARVFSASPPAVATFDWTPEAVPAFHVAEGRDPLASLRALMILGERAWPDMAVLPAGGGVVTGDIWMARANLMRLRIDREGDAGRADCVLRAFQLDIASGTAEALGEWPIGGMESGAFLDAPLRNEFAPIAFTLSDAAGSRLAEAVLPFPSLVRGGAHHGELCAIAPDTSYPAALAREARRFAARLWGAEPIATLACRRICVDLRDANGAEPLFSTQALGWLSRLLGCVVEFERPPDMDAGRWTHFQRLAVASDDVASGLATRRRAGGDLSLPVDALPTLSALSAQAGEATVHAVAGLVLASDGGEGFDLLKIEGDHPDLAGAQSRHAGLRIPLVSGAWLLDATPAAIRFVAAGRDDAAQMLCPVSPDLPGPLLRAAPTEPAPITVAFDSSGDPRLDASALEALRRQRGVGLIEVVVHRIAASNAGDDLLARMLPDLFPGAFRIMPALSRGALAAGVSETILTSTRPLALLLSSAALLHDARTLEALQTVAGGERVASAGCALFHRGPKTKTSSGLALLAPIGSAAGSSGERAASGGISALGPATLPAPGNDRRLAALPVSIFRALGGFDDGCDGLEEAMRAYCSRAFSKGCAHVFTSVATATLREMEDGDGATAWPPGGASIMRLVA